MTLQEQIKQTKAKLAELKAQQLSEIEPGTIVWAWDDDCDEHDARLTILKTVHGPKRYTCQYYESGETVCYDNIKPITLPPSKEDLHKAFSSGWDNHRRLVNGELNVCAGKWIEQNFPEAI